MRKLNVKIREKNKYILLSKYILNIFKSLPYSVICKAFRNKDIRINNIKVSKDTLVNNGDVISIYINDNILFNLPKKIKYYYEDDNILIAYKPQGLLSNNEDITKNILEPTFEELIKKDLHNNNIQICHRLDRNTSGLIIFTKNNIAYKEILNGFKNNAIHKEYIAYVSNNKFSKSHNILNAYLIKDTKTGFSKISQTEIKYSEKIITEYSVLKTNSDLNYAKLNIILHTGKTHQIRAHLASLNHPIIGDSKYGKNEVNRKFKKYKQLLFAYKYTFTFNKNSNLYYLNNIIVELEKNKTEFK